MNITERYKNLLKEFQKELVTNATLKRMYDEQCMNHSQEVQALNIKIAKLTKLQPCGKVPVQLVNMVK